MIPKRVQRKQSKGYGLPPNTKCVSRDTKWGNPFVVRLDGSSEKEEIEEAEENGWMCKTLLTGSLLFEKRGLYL